MAQNTVIKGCIIVTLTTESNKENDKIHYWTKDYLKVAIPVKRPQI